ncbi:transcription elongation factor GreB [Sphingorhabdus arenilitoris]|uniref:Transcription elongation factor GreB n=1 Tax=Sphingorhabdus arenilitoris TaxID=1490041 RepID=A0ABV8RF56_9SPHN
MIRLRPEQKLAERSVPITPAGYAALQARYKTLFEDERPKLVEIVSWAAGNGDRSENGDYQYGKKRLREIDREVRHLSKRMKAANIIDPAEQPDKARIYFGATVTLADEDDNQRSVTIVGDDEADAGAGRIGWNSPLARALRKAEIGDLRIVTLPSGTKEWEVIAIRYPE